LASLKRYYSLIKKVTYLADVIRINNPQSMEGLSENQGQRNSSSCLGQPKEKFLRTYLDKLILKTFKRRKQKGKKKINFSVIS